ncbi:RabGAP/TBC [Epithele typhae]|uniref:RabGAP/TBC n=1 Tax=Epithele typhae TaxID=378194 RepID=UPI002007B604|nr:RabGAP/TBC [Epithele typhae]KAH9915807.1 RabGAP/TBC [Epithele typhae]
MGEPRHRSSVKEIKDAYDHIFNSRATVSKLKDAALGCRLLQPRDGSAGVAGRSLAWKVLVLVPTEPLQDGADVEAAPPLKALRAAREDYRRLLMTKMRAPDGGSGVSPPRTERSGQNLETNNPLSLHDENPWREWFAAMELRKTISRMFPDIAYFRDAEVQAELTNVLYLYSDMHPHIGYRQGMHELLAPLYYAIDYDCLAEDSDAEAEVKEFCARPWVAADAWLLFDVWYEWQEGKTHAMQSAGIEPQIYGIRWLRLLFTREFGMEDAMVMWDGLFAVDPSFDLAMWVCVAMLIRIRNKLIPADYSGQLTLLLRYPSTIVAAGAIQRLWGPSRYNTPQQALTLQMSPSPTTGVPPPVSPPVIDVRGKHREVAPSRLSTASIRHKPAPRQSMHERQTSTPKNLPESFAQSGDNKTVMNAVSELRKNLPDLATALNREIEQEAAQLRATHQKLGDAVGWIVDTLLLDVGEAKDEAHKRSMQNRKREALESLAYVRDVLKGVVTDVEDDRLVGEEEANRRREKEKKAREAAEDLTAIPINARPQGIAAPRRSNDYFMPQASGSSPPTKKAPLSALPPGSSHTVGRTTTPSSLPASIATSPKPNLSSFHAPWSYTKSNFESSDSPIATLPRVPRALRRRWFFRAHLRSRHRSSSPTGGKRRTLPRTEAGAVRPSRRVAVVVDYIDATGLYE